MTLIFLSYRHTDTMSTSAEIASILREHFGQDRVFWDQGTLKYGQNYLEAIDQAIFNAAVMLVCIGPAWLLPENYQKLLSPDDVVLKEITLAQQRGIPIIPIFIDRNVPTPQELPPSLQFLNLQHGIILSSIGVRERLQTILDAVGAYLDDDEFQFRQFPAGACVTPPVIRIWADQFTMGSDERNNEQPKHTVKLSPFAIAKFPVTVGEYNLFLRANRNFSRPTTRTINWLQKSKHPVVNITWQEASLYASWLSFITSQPWRLLTEAEWEMAAGWDAHNHSARRYPWGENFISSKCNTAEGKINQPIEVGKNSNGASAFGVMDMAGNIWEWTASPYLPYPYQPPLHPEQISPSYVVRGGSWRHPSPDSRVTRRLGHSPSHFNNSLGFRLALNLNN